MRNLLGRLNARSADDLNEIADAWQTPLVGRDRLGQISQLYRAMTKPPMVRAQWDNLSPLEQQALRALLEFDDAGATIDELAESMRTEIEDVRSTCHRLYAKGLIAYEGSARTLPIGESPRLFVPIELGNSIRRITREMALGDISDQPFAELLALRSDQDLFEAAAQWGIEFIPGVTTRAEVVASLTRQVTNGVAREAHVAKLGHDVRTIWERLTSVPEGTPVTLDQIIGSGNERTMFNRRNAINELEDRLLAWSMVTDDGTRALFVPLDVSQGQIAPATQATLPKPVSIIGGAVAYRPSAPLAWDLLVVLQRLFGPLAPPNLDPLALSRATALELNQMLWNRGEERPPLGYIEMMIELAMNLQLIEEPQDGASQFERTAEIREWRVKSWDEQNSRIRRVWMASPYWIDGQSRQDIEPWNVDWRGFRIKLLNHLATLEPSTWYRVHDVADWIVEYDPGILGAGATVAVSHAASVDARGEHARALSHLISISIEHVLYWLGLVIVDEPQPGEMVLRITQELIDVVKASIEGKVNAQPKPVVTIADDLTIRLIEPVPIQVWSVLAFAQPVSLGAESVFRITTERVRAAQSAGFRPEQIGQYLARQNPVTAPVDLDERIARLSEDAQGLELSAALAIDATDVDLVKSVRALLENDGYVVNVVGSRLYVTIGTLRPSGVDAARIHALLEAAGIGPVVNRSRS